MRIGILAADKYKAVVLNLEEYVVLNIVVYGLLCPYKRRESRD